MGALDYIPFVGGNPYEDLAPALEKIRDGHDALILFPYDDGTFFFKPGDFDKELLGGKGGYETPDGEKIMLDGAGEPKRNLMGVPVVLACDPTEHSAAIEPMKAYTAHKRELGEWVKVDRRGNILEAGASLEPVDDDLDIGLEGTAVEERANEEEGLTLEDALARMEKDNEVTKIMDFAAPAEPVVTDGGDVELEQATHIAVDQAKAQDMMPRTMSTEEINVALDKARMQEHEEGKLMNYFVYGLIAGGVGALIISIVMGGFVAFI